MSRENFLDAFQLQVNVCSASVLKDLTNIKDTDFLCVL